MAVIFLAVSHLNQSSVTILGLGDVCTHVRRTFARALFVRSLTLTIQFLHCFFILGFFFSLILDMHMRFAPRGVASVLFPFLFLYLLYLGDSLGCFCLSCLRLLLFFFFFPLS